MADENQDLKVVKTELFDVDAMENLLTHDGVCKKTKKLLKDYKHMRVNGNTVQVIYEYGKKLKSVRVGRLYPQRGLGLQNFPSDVRACLAQKYYWDVDMANSQPVLLYQMAKKRGWSCDHLKDYVENRSEKLHEIMEMMDCDREGAKQMCISVMFGAQFNRAPPFILALQQELVVIAQNIVEISGDLRKALKDADAKSIVAHVLQDQEFKILQFIDKRLQEHGRYMDVYIHDGGLVRKEDDEKEFPRELMNKLELAVKEKFEFVIRLEPKPLTHTFDFSVKDTRRIVAGDKGAGDLLYKDLKSSLVYSQGQFYMRVNNVWTTAIDELERDLRRYVMEANLWTLTKEGNPTSYSQKASNAQNCVKVIMDNAVADRNDLWSERLFESSRGKVLFRNGYYDMRGGFFAPCDTSLFDESIIFTEEIPFDYSPFLLDSEYQKSICERFFTVPFEQEMGDFYRLKLARGLAWDREKKFLAGIGSSNTGKSAISSALKHSIGGYFGTWNGANLCYRASSQDEAQKLRWMYLLRHKRIIVSNELQVGGMGIDGNMIKKMANGGYDDIVAREHGGNETSFKVGFLPLLFAQDLDRIRPLDDAVMTRLRAINYQKVYVDEPSNVLELKIDRGLEQEMLTDRFRMNFLQLLFQTYYNWVEGGCDETEPECVRLSVKEVVGSESNIIDAFLNDFEITNKEEDYIRSSDVEAWMTEGKYRVTMTKFGMEMNRHCKIKGHDYVGSKRKKLGGKTVVCWTGIRRMGEEDMNLPQ